MAVSARLVYASSSSVYGNQPSYPVDETAVPHPFSPYGVTKLAAEHMCSLYAQNYGLSTVSLRFFTVYGPRQRPDMAFSKFIRATLAGAADQGDRGRLRDPRLHLRRRHRRGARSRPAARTSRPVASTTPAGPSR